MTTRQTANLSGKGQYIRFIYEQGRLKRVSYPEHPENDVIYHYGDENAEQGLRGRVKFREDGSGGNEYHYDLLGNVNRMKRTVTVPGSMIATAEMTWTYDNFGKLTQMHFPRANGISERITYHYDRAGQLQSVYNGDLAGYHYVQEIGYDKFGDRVHIKYGNDVENNLSYRADNRRLYTQTVTGDGGMRMHRSYSYDPIGNITGMSTSSASLIFPSVNHYYYYDNLNRLYRAQGHTGINSTSYRVDLGYDNLYRITSKRQTAQRSGPQDQGTYYAGYNLGYSYNQSAGKKFQMSTVSDTNYRTALVAPTANDSVREAHSYEYDNNGNILYVNTLRLKPDMTAQPDTVQRTREEKFRWDEENRLTALSQNGYVSHYWYDADGERTVKMHGGSMAVFVNSERDGRMLDMQPSTAYFSPYFSIQGNSFTKHIYIGSERIASMTGTLSPGDVSNSPAGGYNISHAGYDVGVTQLNIPYATRRAAMIDSAEANYAYFDLPNALEGQTRQTREFVLPAEDSDNAGNSVSGNDGSVGSGTGPRGDNTYYGNIWFIHADHLGSSTLVTDGNGGVSQQIEYLPYGEVFLEKRASGSTYATPYKFNGKELDEETGLYYYGARYMNPRLSIWYGCDPMQEKYPNVNTYAYCMSNPLTLIDEEGEQPIYNMQGDFLGTTLEGFTGTVLMYTGSLKLSFNKYSAEELLNGLPLTMTTFDKVKKQLSGDAMSRIWTHIIGEYEGMQVFDEKFSLSEIESSSIPFRQRNNSSWFTYPDIEGKNLGVPKIFGTGNYDYETTVENIASSVIVHEWYSHGKKFCGSKYFSHRLAYQNVVNFKPLWNKTTNKYKKFVLDKIREYNFSENGYNNVPKLYQRLYDRYVRKYVKGGM